MPSPKIRSPHNLLQLRRSSLYKTIHSQSFQSRNTAKYPVQNRSTLLDPNIRYTSIKISPLL